MYVERTVDTLLSEAAGQFPALVLTGPRQTGKTTTLKQVFGGTHRYVSLDEPDVRLRASEDPRLFLRDNPPPVIVDEIQHVPDLLSYIKVLIDENRTRKGAFILSGSQHFSLMRGVTESLAGRAAPFTLMSLSLAERCGLPLREPFWIRGTPETGETPSPQEVWNTILAGGYPEVVTGAVREPERFYRAYLQTYLERDVRSLRTIGSLSDFERFLFAAAARAGQLINMSQLALDLGISQGSVRAWFSVLEASGQVLLVRPYHRNLGKRIVKRPKLFFLDTGLLASLVHLSDCDHARRGPMAGPLFETAVLAEIHRAMVHRGETPAICFWRSAAGHEVDFVVERGGRTFGFEVKAAATPRGDDVKSLVLFKDLLGDIYGGGALVCLSQESFQIAGGVWAAHLWNFC